MFDVFKAPAIITVLFAALMTVVFLSAPTYAETSEGSQEVRVILSN